jgi:uncharacterized protein YuzE
VDAGQAMKIRFDREVDALYLQLSEASIADSETIDTDVVYDYDANNEGIGIELLRVSTNLQRLAIMQLPFQNWEQQPAFISFLETIADNELPNPS